MKLLVVLLACVAVANASSWTYSYQYYCAHKFYVYPTAHYYCFHVYFPSTWCSHSYYDNILKVYPGDDCGTKGWKERAPADIMAEVKNLLNAALAKMTNEMYAKRNAWVSHLNSVHDQYKYYFKKYMYIFYSYKIKCSIVVGVNYIKERDDKIKAYCAKLDQLKNHVTAQYNAAIAKKIAILKAYHAKLIEHGTKCLTTRATKLAEYRTHVTKTIHDSIMRFAKLHLAILYKKRDCYREALQHTFAKNSDWWTRIKGDISVRHYYYAERTKVENFVRIYALKVATHYKSILKYYICSYKCYLSGGYLRFYRSYYYNHCHSIGTWHTYRTNYHLSKYCVHPFCFNYNYCHVYNKLNTCDVHQDDKNAAKVIEEMKKRMNDAISQQNSRFYTWKSLWVGYHLKYKAEFERIVRERHAWYCTYRRSYYIHFYGCLTPVYIHTLAQLKIDLKAKAEAVCRKFYADLVAKIVECVHKHAQNQAEFKRQAEQTIAHLQAKYNECAAKKKTAIADYEKKLKDQRAAQRAAMIEKLNHIRSAHWSSFQKMMAHFHGTNYMNIGIIRAMMHCYSGILDQRVKDIIARFDAYWTHTLPKLVHHFTCNYKCTISACSYHNYHYGGFYSWVYHLPTQISYSYQYSCWRAHHGC